MENDEIEFVKLEEKDIPECAEVYFSAFEICDDARRICNTDYYFSKYIFDEDKYAYGIRYKGEIVGLLTGVQLPALLCKYSIYLDCVAVLPEFQGRGFGTKMLNNFFESVSGEAVVGLNTYRDSKQYQFYKRLRFKGDNVVHLERTHIDYAAELKKLQKEWELEDGKK
ncbi:MAG: GNAT family N-acetyltransferase [Ruminiclostridium sp.]